MQKKVEIKSNTIQNTMVITCMKKKAKFKRDRMVNCMQKRLEIKSHLNGMEVTCKQKRVNIKSNS